MLDLKREYAYMKKDIDAAIKRCLDHQRWILGPEVKQLEDNVATYLGVRHCVGTSSGTESLLLSLRALAIKLKGAEYFEKADRIITTPFTFTATGDTILRSGATPVFVDIDPVTFNIDPVKIREFLTLHPTPDTRHSRVVGIMPVHLYGQSCNMDEIMKIAEEHNLFVLEDVAQAFGGMWKGKKLGSIGTVGAFSFFPSKNLGGFGDGGMVATNDAEVAELLRMLLKHGGKDKYNVDHIGYNARLDTLQAAVLLAKLKYVDELNSRRRAIAETYSRVLGDVPGITLPVGNALCQPVQGVISEPFLPPGHVYHQYTVRIQNGKRDRLQRHLKERGVETAIYYPVPLHHMPVFADERSIHAGPLTEAEEASRSVLSLPLEPLFSDAEISLVAGHIRHFFSEAR